MALRPRAGPSVLDLLTDDDDAALLSTARGLALWHRSIRFCSNCGSSDVRMYRGGKRCESCGTRFRPRLDTSIIVLVTNQSRNTQIPTPLFPICGDPISPTSHMSKNNDCFCSFFLDVCLGVRRHGLQVGTRRSRASSSLARRLRSAWVARSMRSPGCVSTETRCVSSDRRRGSSHTR